MESKGNSLKRASNEIPNLKLKQNKITSFFTKKDSPLNSTQLITDKNEALKNQTQSSKNEIINTLPSLTTCVDHRSESNEDTDPTPSRPNSQPKEPTDISKSKDDGAIQIKLKNYPQTNTGNKLRSFGSVWLNDYPLLEYSIITDQVYCFVCRHFSTQQTSSLVTGYSDWKNLSVVLPKHFLSKDHLFNQEKYISYQKAKSQGVLSLINSHHKTDVIRNRSVLAAHSEIVLFCAQQDIALRGHREHDDDKNGYDFNKGNFLSLLHLMKSKSPQLEKFEREMPQNSKYTSPDIQNEIIHIAAQLVRKEIAQNILENGGNFSVVADETRDSAGTEQLSVCVRYFHESRIYERFLGFKGLKKFDAVSISGAILEILEFSGLSIKNCVSQAYDGAAVMAGDVTGVHARLEKEVGGYCPYIHCYAHKLNLVLVDSCKSIKEVVEFFGLLQSIYNFQCHSSRRSIYFEDSQKSKECSPILKIPQSCDPRWSSKKKGIFYFKSRLDSVILGFENIIKTGKPEEMAESKGYLHQIRSFEVVVLLILMDKVLSLTNSLSEYLQDSQLSLPRANKLCAATITSLEEIRNESGFLEVWEESKELAQRCKIEYPVPDQRPTKRKKSVSSKLKNAIVMSTVGERREPETYEGKVAEFRRIFFEIIDKFVAEMKRRISANDKLSIAVSAADPSSSDFLNPDFIMQFFQLYTKFKVNKKALRSQISVARNFFKSEKVENSLDCYNCLLKMKASFPDLLVYFYLVNLIPVSSSVSERSFSSLKRIKTRLRSTMLDIRTSDLTILSIERDLSNISYKNSNLIVDEFAKVGNRRLELCL